MLVVLHMDIKMCVPARGTSLLLFVLSLAIAFTLISSLELRKASQCFKSRGIPKVEFHCPPDQMIKIHRAFHGIAVNDRNQMDPDQCPPSPGHVSTNCTQCDGDCIDDSMNLVYDWSTCMGNTSCIRTVMQSYMPSCPGRDKFSDYLQVEYNCVPRAQVIDICTHLERTMEEGFLMSPHYPLNYPVNQDCLCRIYTDWSSRVVLSLYDLLLETKNGRCRADWLMLRQKDQKHRHCGAIMTGTKNITSETNAIEIQFHSDENDNRTQNFQYFTRSLKGFWLYFTSSPPANLKVACRRLTPTDPEVREIATDDEEFEEVISSRDLLTTSMNGLTKDEGEKVRPTESPNTKDGEKRRRPRPDHKENNSKDKNSANYLQGNGAGTRTMDILITMATLTMTTLMIQL